MNALAKYNELKQMVSRKQGVLDGYRKMCSDIESENLKLAEQKEKIEKCIIVAQLIVENRQQSVVDLFEETVTSALQDIFGEEYSFQIKFGTRNNVTTADFLIHTGEYVGYLPIAINQGNSLKSIVGYVLRTIFQALMEGRKFVALDEPFEGVERDKESAVGKFVSTVCEKFNIQTIMVTHKAGIYEFADNKVYL